MLVSYFAISNFSLLHFCIENITSEAVEIIWKSFKIIASLLLLRLRNFPYYEKKMAFLNALKSASLFGLL